MASSGMLRRVVFVRTDVSEELSNLVFFRSVRRLLVTANVVPSSQILVTLMIEALLSSRTSVPTRATRRNVPEDGILHSHRRENLKSHNSKIISQTTSIETSFPSSFIAFDNPRLFVSYLSPWPPDIQG
jgi:hypothetical protein